MKTVIFKYLNKLKRKIVSFLKEKTLLDKIDKLENKISVLEAQNKKLKKQNQKLKEEKAKAKKEFKEERQKINKEKYLLIVMEKTGWDRAYAIEKMERAREIAGSSFEHYAIYRFWELTEDEQKTYFTKRDAVALRRKYNPDKQFLQTFINKDLCCAYFDKFGGRPWLSTETMTYEMFKNKFGNEKKLIYKPRAKSGGHGIQAFDLQKDTLDAVYQQVKELPTGIVEGYLTQHSKMSKLSLNSVNTIRVVTIQTNQDIPGVEKNKVHFLYAGVRMGRGNSVVDNLHSGGMIAAVNIETGEVVTGGVDHTGTVYLTHPDTDVPIKGFTIPEFDKVRELIEQASVNLPGYFGWDIAISDKGPVIVEINTSPGADGLQTPYVPEKKGMRHIIEKYL